MARTSPGNMLHEAAALLEFSGEEAASRLYHNPDDPVPYFPGGKRFLRLVTAIGVIEYVQDRKRFVRGLADLMEPGGYLILSNSQNGSLFVALCIASHVLRFRPRRAWFRMIGNLARTGIWTAGYVDIEKADPAYNAGDLDRLAAEAGLEIVDGIDFFGLPGLDRNPLNRYWNWPPPGPPLGLESYGCLQALDGYPEA